MVYGEYDTNNQTHALNLISWPLSWKETIIFSGSKFQPSYTIMFGMFLQDASILTFLRHFTEAKSQDDFFNNQWYIRIPPHVKIMTLPCDVLVSCCQADFCQVRSVTQVKDLFKDGRSVFCARLGGPSGHCSFCSRPSLWGDRRQSFSSAERLYSGQGPRVDRAESIARCANDTTEFMVKLVPRQDSNPILPSSTNILQQWYHEYMWVAESIAISGTESDGTYYM